MTGRPRTVAARHLPVSDGLKRDEMGLGSYPRPIGFCRGTGQAEAFTIANGQSVAEENGNPVHRGQGWMRSFAGCTRKPAPSLVNLWTSTKSVQSGWSFAQQLAGLGMGRINQQNASRRFRCAGTVAEPQQDGREGIRILRRAG